MKPPAEYVYFAGVPGFSTSRRYLTWHAGRTATAAAHRNGSERKRYVRVRFPNTEVPLREAAVGRHIQPRTIVRRAPSKCEGTPRGAGCHHPNLESPRRVGARA